MKRLLLIFLLVPIAYSLDCSNLDPLYINTATMNYNAYGDINFVFESQQTVIEDLTARIRAIPQTNGTITSYTGSFSLDEFGNDVLIYSQDEITTTKVSWNLESTVSNAKELLLFNTNPVFPYPYTNLPLDVRQYTEFTEVADSSPEITNKVNELVSGVTDYLSVINIISKFVAHYLEYNLNYAPSSVPASQVYEQGSGVCDEFSSLMASMLRSVGIPTRFVSGFAYTNIGTPSCTNFGPHSWIEVYVPDYGWVSIDPTYKEFSGVDAGHVPLYRSNDASTKIINASILYVDASFTIEAPNFDIEFTQFITPSQILEFNAEIFNNTVFGESDYVLINVTINNPLNYWILDSLYLTKTVDTALVYNNRSIPVLLPPKQDSSYYFILLTPAGLSTGYIYTYPVLLSLASGGNKLLNVTVNPSNEVETDLNQLMNAVSTSAKQFNSNMAIINKNLTPSKVTTNQPTLSFSIQNLGNVVLEDVQISIDYGSKHLTDTVDSVFISEVYYYSKKLELPRESGLTEVEVTVTAGNQTLSFTESFTIVTSPSFTFTITGDEEYTSNEDYELQLGFSNIPTNFLTANLQVLINGERAVDKQYYFTDNIVLLDKDYFDYGENTIKAILEYDTAEGDEYYTEATTTVTSSREYTFVEQIGNFFQAIIDLFKLLLGL